MPVSVPVVNPTAARSIQVLGGENLFRIAEQELGDATQWWRIALLNFYPGEQPDFILSADDAARLGGVLQIPPVNPNAVWSQPSLPFTPLPTTTSSAITTRPAIINPVPGNLNVIAGAAPTGPLYAKPAQPSNVLYLVTLHASPSADGKVSGGGAFTQGSSVTVTATPNNGFSFVNWTTSGSASADNGVSFDGATADLHVPGFFGASVTQLVGGLSFSCWFKTLASVSGTLIGTTGSASDPNAASNWENVLYLNNSGHLQGGWYDGSVRTITSTGTVNDGVYHHAVITFIDSGNIQLFVDGVSQGTVALGTGESGTIDLWLANGKAASWPNNTGTGDNWFNGALCDFRVFNRVISNAEISTLFTGGNVSSGLIGQYLVPTATSVSANDLSGNGKNGSFNGSPTTTSGPSVFASNAVVVSTSESYTFTLDGVVDLTANFT